MSTKITSNIGKSSLEESKWTPPDDISEFMEFSPVNDHERKLIDYTNYLLSTEGNDYPVGSYPITHIMQISNCIDSWIASGEHRYLGAQQAELLVKRLIMERGGGRSLVKKGEIEFAGGNLDVTWDMYHLEPLIHWLNGIYHGKEFTNKILSIMSTFEEEFEESIDVPYKSIVATLCKCDTGHAAITAEQILHHYESMALSGAKHFDLSTKETYNNLITSWVNSDQSSYPRGYSPNYQHSRNPPANILYEMLANYKQNPQCLSRLRPDRISFNMAIFSLSNHHKMEQPTASYQYLNKVRELAFYFLKSMIESYREGNDDCCPDMITFSTVLNMLGQGDDGDRAIEVLDEMLGLYKHNVTPSTYHFNVVLGLMANQNRVDHSTLNKAKEYLAKMEELTKHGEQIEVPDQNYTEGSSFYMPKQANVSSIVTSKPDIVTYNSLIKIASNAGMPEAAQAILNDIIDRSIAGDVSVKPDVISFNTVLKAWSNSNKRTVGAKSTEILHTMQKLSERGDFHVKPDNVSLTTVINSLVKSSKRTRGAPIQAETIIRKMEENEDYAFKPDAITYTSLIKCWSESGRPKAASRAEEIIELLHERYNNGHKECKPDSTAYNVALNAIAKSGVRDSAERAEALLRRMKEEYDAGDIDLAPNTFSFSIVINAWSKSGHQDAGIHAEKHLDKMIELHESGLNGVAPNTVTYSSCIHAWSRSKHKDAGRRASKMLKRMDELDDKGYINIRPNIYSFTSAMEAWINSGDPMLYTEASVIFELLIDRYKSGEIDAKPTTQTFNAMFRAISQGPSLEQAKYIKAEQLLNRMKKMHRTEGGPKPNIATYNTFLYACACTEGDRATKLAAIACVLNALTELQNHSSLRPDSYTWPAIWKACINLLDIKQDMQRLNSVFELCARSGEMSELVFNNIRNFLPPKYLQKKLNTTKDVFTMTAHDLPHEWTSNVKLRRQRNREFVNKGRHPKLNS